MDLQHSNNKKFMLCKFAKGHCFWILWTLDCVDFVPFYSINSLYMADNEAKWFKKILFSNFLCWRGPIKSVLFIHQYVCLSVRLWHISPKMYFVDFFVVVVVLFFALGHFAIYTKKWKNRIWKIEFVICIFG